MVNVKKLKGKLVECGMNVEAVADRMGMDRATFYRRLRELRISENKKPC